MRGGAPRYRWIVLAIATFTQAASGFFVQGIGALGIHLQRDLSLSTAQLVPLIGLLVAGELLDRCDERWVVGAGACVVAAGRGVGSRAPGYGSLLCVPLVVGAGYSTPGRRPRRSPRPGLLIALCITWGRPGWYVVGALFLLTGLAAPPAVRWALRRQLARRTTLPSAEGHAA